MKNRIIGILSLVLFIFAFMFSQTTQSGYCMGDSFLRALGLRAWSMESAQLSTNGFHYTFLFFLAFLILGYEGAKHYLKDFYPWLVENLVAIGIILVFTSNQIFTWGYGVALSYSEGVNAVDYIPRQSNCNYISASSDNIEYTYQITLKNYSDKRVKFNMQVQKAPREPIAMWDVTTREGQGKQIPKEFLLHPREQKEIRFVMSSQDSRYHNVTGGMQRPNIIISDDKSSRKFSTF